MHHTVCVPKCIVAHALDELRLDEDDRRIVEGWERNGITSADLWRELSRAGFDIGMTSVKIHNSPQPTCTCQRAGA